MTRAAFLAVLALAGLSANAQTPSAEYIRLGGRVIAIEHPQPVAVTVLPSSASVPLGGTQQFTASVTGAADQSVTWTVEPAGNAYGTIPAGLYTAPGSMPSPSTVTIRATSVADSTKSGTATVSLQSAACPLTLYSGTVPNGGGTVGLMVQCPAGVSWTSAVPPADQSWASVNASSGVGSQNVNVIAQSNLPGSGARSTNITIAGQTFTLTQLASATLAIDPATATMNHGETKRFTALANGTPVTAVWSKVAGIGEITAATGDYTAPFIVQPSETNVTIRADYTPGNATATAAITLSEYAPPGSMAVTPSNTTALNQTFTVSATDVHGAYAIDYVWAHFTEGIDQPSYPGCNLQINTTTQAPFGNTVQLMMDGASGWSEPVGFGTGAVLENAECRVDLAASSISRFGNTVTINLALRAKPGFVGLKGVYGRARNTDLIISEWQQIGQWNLSANVQALAPTLAFESPAAGATVAGDVAISGWAIDNATQVENPISGITVYVDGQNVGGATYGIQRTDVCNTYPGRHGCPNVGYRMTWNARSWTNGTHTIRVVARDGDYPAKTTESTRTVTLNNPPGAPVVIEPAASKVRIYYEARGPRIAMEQETFVAKISGVPYDATWSMSPAPSAFTGNITAGGFYTSPSNVSGTPGTQISVTGVLVADPTRSNSTTFNLSGILFPDQIQLPRGQRYWFYTSGFTTLTGYTATAGTFDSNGWYTAPTNYLGEVILEAHSASNWNTLYRTKVTITP